VVLAATAATLVGAIGASTASAYQQNLIREVHETGANGDYVVLQAYAPGQNMLATKRVVTYDGGGNVFSSVILNNVPNGANQATVLAGDDVVPGADATDAGFNVVNTGGTVCFTENAAAPPFTGIDCVAYTNGVATFPAVPPASPYGTPVTLPGGDLTGMSLARSIGRGCATLLEAADDTNDSASDFVVTAATNPRNNASPITETTCPNPPGPIPPGPNPPNPACASPTLTGTAGNDVLRGTRKKDVISGLAGNDTITGLNGKDTACGGDGDDSVSGNNAKDRLFGDAGNDTLSGGNGKDSMDGGDGTDTCNGGRGKDKAVNCEAGTDANQTKKGKGPKAPKPGKGPKF
jgi:hypothetical protein